MTPFGDHFGILPMKKVAYFYQSGNQARIVLKWPLNKNDQWKFKWNNISR